MNWIKANKFLTGFLAVMLVGIGALGYLLLTASGAYDSATENYNSKATEFNRLETPSALSKPGESQEAWKLKRPKPRAW